MSQANYLEPSGFRAYQPEGSVHPRVEIAGKMTILAAQLKLIFPLSRRSEYVSVQDGDGKEVGILKALSELDKDSRAVCQEQLERRYFTPTILQLMSLRQEAGMWHFTAQTSRGEAEFYVRNWRDSGFEIAPGRWQINSVDGGRFEIPNLGALDETSQRLMDQLL
jgi:hypothetical protein